LLFSLFLYVNLKKHNAFQKEVIVIYLLIAVVNIDAEITDALLKKLKIIKWNGLPKVINAIGSIIAQKERIVNRIDVLLMLKNKFFEWNE
jgi:hypothetical protein